MIQKAYKYKVYPSEEQKVQLAQHFGCARFVYNYGLTKKIKEYQTSKKTISCFDLINEVTKMKDKEEFKWLAAVNSQALQMSLRNLDNAFTNFFRKQNKFPRFKSKKNNRQSFQCPQNVKVNFKAGTIQIPKLKEVPAILHRKFKGKIKTSTVSKTPTGKYFISILVEEKGKFPKKPKVREKTLLGIDLGIKDFATLSNGTKISNPRYLDSSLKRFKVVSRQFSKKQKGSKNREQAKRRLALVHERISNQRSDFLHKLTHQLTHDNQVSSIGIEDLNIKGMVKNHCLARCISDASWGKFVQYLKYKCDWYGKNLTQIGRFEPSSKICHMCGLVNNKLTLDIRNWTCECGVNHDRDLNAALNIKNFAYLTHIRNQGTGSESKQSLAERCPIGRAKKQGGQRL